MLLEQQQLLLLFRKQQGLRHTQLLLVERQPFRRLSHKLQE